MTDADNFLSAYGPRGQDKVLTYRWQVKDEPGVFRYIKKESLYIDESYQRRLVPTEVAKIAREWSWLKCGCLVVCERHHKHYIVDGQQRHGAALKRSDIEMLPCLVFPSLGVRDEADSFYDSNVIRKTVSAIDKHRAAIVAGRQDAIAAQAVLDSLGLHLTETATKFVDIKCIGLVTKRCVEDAGRLAVVLDAVLAACEVDAAPVDHILVDALWYIDKDFDGVLGDKRFRQRLTTIGSTALIKSAKKEAAYYAYGGAKVYARGVMEEINRGLRKKFTPHQEKAA